MASFGDPAMRGMLFTRGLEYIGDWTKPAKITTDITQQEPGVPIAVHLAFQRAAKDFAENLDWRLKRSALQS